MIDIVKALKASTELPVYANSTDDVGSCVIYDLNPLSYDGIKAVWRMKVQIRARSMDEGLKVQSDISHGICTIGDNPLTDTVLQVRQNGGGWLEDGDWHIRIAYYEFLTKGGY